MTTCSNFLYLQLSLRKIFLTMKTQVAIILFHLFTSGSLIAQNTHNQLDSLLTVSENLASEGRLKQAKDRTLGLLAIFSDSLSRAKIYNFVGNLCMNYSIYCIFYNQIERSFVYLFAYDMYERAGNKLGMEGAKRYCHSHNNSFVCAPLPTSGSRVRIGCWIQDTTIFRWRENMK